MAARLKNSLIKYLKGLDQFKNIPAHFNKSELSIKVKEENITPGFSGVLKISSTEDEENCLAGFNNFNSNNKIEIPLGEMMRNINITNFCGKNSKLNFEIDKNDFIKYVLSSDLTNVQPFEEKKNIIVEYSSPNLGKELHLGHLKSTMVGNFIANVLTKLGDNVVKLNYLGDYGTPIGMIIIGMENLGYKDDFLNTSAVGKLHQAYVHGCSLASNNEELKKQALDMFNKLESEDEELMEKWKHIKKLTVLDLESVYKDLGVKFDNYEWESSYNKKKAEGVLNRLKEIGALKTREDGPVEVELPNGKAIVLLRSDGSSLYLLRDIAAFLDRKKRFHFDKMYYVVDTAQTGHFRNLKMITEMIEPSSCDKIEHVAVGRVVGASSRFGNEFLLRDLLAQVQREAFERQKNSKTSKEEPNMETAAILGRTALILSTFSKKRKNEYRFSWNDIFNTNNIYGSRIQYAHCRICSLNRNMQNAGLPVVEECDPDCFTEKQSLHLIAELAMFDYVVHCSAAELDPSLITHYLMRLTSSINSALDVLRVADTPEHLASHRLHLFNCSKQVVAEGLRLLGIPALEKI